MRVLLDPTSPASYETFLSIKSLPQYRFVGRTAIFPDEYAARLGIGKTATNGLTYKPIDGLFDYQRDIVRTALRKRRYAIFADCGLGKTLMFLEWARYVRKQIGTRNILIISPLMVVPQTIAEASRFYGDKLPLTQVRAAELRAWMSEPHDEIGITNYDALRPDVPADHLGALILDESSMLKSHYGKWASECLRLGRGLEWKLACTGTPAPNDRIEYANHAVFLDAFPTVNAFLAKYFVNRGQTDNRWELKPHAIEPFYRHLSHWCIFITNPATYGWKDNCENIPPIITEIHHIDLTDEQQKITYDKTGTLFADRLGGITSRSVLSQIAKGSYRGERIASHKPAFIRYLIQSWPDESVLIWCWYNAEQAILSEMIPEAGSISGQTPEDARLKIIDDFKARRIRVLISKPKILGFGLNLQVATRQVFSGLNDSYEAYYQAVKRSNRYGSTKPLHVHLPVTDIERPLIDTVLTKAKRVQADTEAQERLFQGHYNG